MVRVQREEPALPVLLEVDGRLVDALVEGWVLERGKQPRAQVRWTEMRPYGYPGTRLDVVDADRIKPQPGT